MTKTKMGVLDSLISQRPKRNVTKKQDPAFNYSFSNRSLSINRSGSSGKREMKL